MTKRLVGVECTVCTWSKDGPLTVETPENCPRCGANVMIMVEDVEHAPTVGRKVGKGKILQNASTEDVIAELKERDINVEQAKGLEDHVTPFTKWKQMPWETNPIEKAAATGAGIHTEVEDES